MGKILIVDDDRFMSRLVEQVLEKAGHEVVVTNAPVEALTLARETAADVAVLDVMMPDLSGFDILRSFREDPALSSMPVLFLSALDDSKDRVAGLREGADDYLGKPFDVEELVARVERLLTHAQRLQPAPAHPSEVTSEPRFGRYVIREVIARGSMGTVFRGWDPVLRRELALKTLHLDQREMGQFGVDLVASLLEEAVQVAQVNHANVVTVYDAANTSDGPFIAMEYVAGKSLAELVRDIRRLPIRAGLALGVALARALEAAHARGIVHHDVKPANVLLGLDGAIKLGDFGLAGALSTAALSKGMVFGTPGFISPEALRAEPVDTRGDLFGLGAVLYRCLTGWEPFRGPDLNRIVSATLYNRPVAPDQLEASVPPDLSALILQLLEVEVDHRPSDATEVVERLEAAGPASWDPDLVRDAPTAAEPPVERIHGSCTIEIATGGGG